MPVDDQVKAILDQLDRPDPTPRAKLSPENARIALTRAGGAREGWCL